MRRLQRALETISTYRRNYGWWNLVLKLFLKACPFFTYYETILYVRNLGAMSLAGIRPKREVSYASLDENDYATVAQIKNPEDPDFIRKRLAFKEQCFVAKDRGSICCYFWIAPGKREVEHEARMLMIREDQIYIHDCFTVEQYRGMGILPYFIEQTCFVMRAQGYRKALAVVYNDNYSSRRCFEKIGFQKSELTRHFVIPFLKRKYYTRKALLADSSG